MPYRWFFAALILATCADRSGRGADPLEESSDGDASTQGAGGAERGPGGAGGSNSGRGGMVAAPTNTSPDAARTDDGGRPSPDVSSASDGPVAMTGPIATLSYPADTPGGPVRIDQMGPSDPCKDISLPEGTITVGDWQPSLWLPGGVRPVRCLIGGASYLRELARMHHCGVIRQPPPSMEVLQQVLKAYAEMTGHPELEHLQVIGSGYSAAFGKITGLAARTPERFLAIFGGGIHQAFPAQGGILGVPWLAFAGSRDGPNEATNTRIFTGHLDQVGPRGALYAVTMRWNKKHEVGDSRHLMFPFYHQVIGRRAPRPGEAITKLTSATLRREDGWLMSAQDWHTPYPTIAAYADYKGDKDKANWLPDAYMAHVARAYTAGSGISPFEGRTTETVLSLTQPPCANDECTPRSAGVKSAVLFEVQLASGEPPQALELWDGDKRLVSIPGPPPWRVQITDWPPGVHAIYALGIWADGKKVLSKPRTVAVNRPGMAADGCRPDAGM